jgi:hypothetical protein
MRPRRTLRGDLARLRECFQTIIAPLIRRQMSRYSPPPTCLTYLRLIELVLDLRPADPRVRCAAILRDPCAAGFLVHLRYLDGDNCICGDSSNRPFGRSMTVASFDDELLERFDNKRALIVR